MTEQQWLPRRRPSSSSGGVGRRGASANTNRSTSMSTVSASGSEWDDRDEWQGGESRASAMPGAARKRREEPMSPVVVVLYVAAFWLVWQILTRPDDMDILSPRPAASPIHQPQTPPSLSHSQYNLPYPMPQLPSAIPTVAPSSPWWRVVLSVLVYPIYVAVTLLAVPLPFILNALSLILQIFGSLLWPVTMSFRLFVRTFIRGPWGVVRGVFEMLYPLYVFAAGLVGVGCVLGVGAGWVGRVCLGWFVQSKEGGKKARDTKRLRRRSSVAYSSPSPTTPELAPRASIKKLERRHSSHRAASGPAPLISNPNPKLRRADTIDAHSRAYSRQHLRPTPPSGNSTERPVALTRKREQHSQNTLLESVSLFSGEKTVKGMQWVWKEEEGRGTAREPVVLGVRRRGVREASARA